MPSASPKVAQYLLEVTVHDRSSGDNALCTGHDNTRLRSAADAGVSVPGAQVRARPTTLRIVIAHDLEAYCPALD